jgi:hypothetical protein
MRCRRIFSPILLCVAVLAACSGSGPAAPFTGDPLYLTNGPDSSNHTGPSSGQTSNASRSVTGWVLGMGPAGDTANYTRVSGTVVTLRLPDDSASNTRGQQVASATSGSDGTFSLGPVKPGPYILEATAPASSPYRVTHWGFIITEYAPSRIELGVVLYRR